MDEYFCPNCGALLNNQYGFDPSCGTWTCACCGKHLMDDDVYEDNLYEGIAWYCDDCGALLNRQLGFSDIFDVWICTECGHCNSITGDDVYESQEDYEQHRDDSRTTGLSSVLAELFGVAINIGVQAYSEKRQRERQVEAERQAEAKRVYQERKKERKVKNALLKKRAKAFLFGGKKIELHYDCEKLIGQNVSFVVSALVHDAFSNIKTVPIKDVYVGSEYNVGQVVKVIIGGSSSFREGARIPYDAEIVISYHDKREITVPFSERSFRNMNYVLAGDKLQELGFTEIYKKPIPDLTTGWIRKNGAVEKIVIDDVYPFKKNSIFAYDAEIIIEYHTFKKKRDRSN